MGKTQKELIKYLQKELRKYKKLSVVDPLTGLYNRRKLNKDLPKYFAREKRYNLQYTVLMIDIDNFKNINDTKGHKAGDNILKKIAKIITKQVRKGDNVYRLSGDEFIVIYCSHRTFSVIDRIKYTLYEQHIEVSIGHSPLQKNILEIVDKKMYEDKRRKR